MSRTDERYGCCRTFINKLLQAELVSELLMELGKELFAFLAFRTAFSVQVLTCIHLELAMNRADDSYTMVSIFVLDLAIIVAVAVDFFGFSDERFSSDRASAQV